MRDSMLLMFHLPTLLSSTVMLLVHAEVRKKDLLLLQQEVEIMFELMRYVSKQVVKRQGRMGWSGATCVHIILEIRVVSLVTVLLFTTIMHGKHVVHCSSNVATTPPRGWNSYDAFSWIISEEVFLENALVVAEKLIPFGYEYVVVDFLWYRENDGTASTTRGKDFVDKYGRPQPDPQRWPSSRNGQGFKHVADKVHNMGLKFGIHVMRGISLAAVDKNTLILNAKGSPDASGRSWTARDIALLGEECAWMRNSFTRVNLSCSGGQAFIESLYQQYADWGVDLVKHDCIFGSDLVLDEVTAVSQVIANTGRPIVYSLSPGVGATPAMALQVAHLANMYRVSRDNWDSWNSLQPHFDIARDFASAGLVGVNQAQGGRSWPDLDMLPFGFLTNPDDSRSVDRPCDLTVDEQQTEMTLWAIAKSPLMFGGDLRYLDDTTFSLLTNVLVLQMNAHSTGNTQLIHTSSRDIEDTRIWVAAGTSGEWFIAVFNLGSSMKLIPVNLAEVKQALDGDNPAICSSSLICEGIDVWKNQFLENVTNYVNATVPMHGAVLYSIKCSCLAQYHALVESIH